MKVRVQEGATAGEEGLARGEEPHSLADVYPPNSMAAPPTPRNSAIWGRQEGCGSITAATN